MSFIDGLFHAPVSSIQVLRDERQRREISVDDLLPSIKLRGVLVPIIVEKRYVPGQKEPAEYILIAGERRLTACKELGLETIPCRLLKHTSVTERKIIELEENVKRKDLPWDEMSAAVREIHNLYLNDDKEWTASKTANMLGMSEANISKYLAVAEEMSKGNTHVTEASGLAAAYNLISRQNNRAVDNVMNELLFDNASSSNGKMLVPDGSGGHPSPRVNEGSTPSEATIPIFTQDFHEFAQTYTGPPFNFLHCDFPYGIGHDKSDQGNAAGTHEAYDDSEETYWKLCETLARNVDKILAPSAHIVFWLSSDIERQSETLSFFRSRITSIELQPVPIYWFKTDNRGILPDPKRGPRRVVETALIGSRGDRLIIKSTSNCYGSPTIKDHHTSEKPEPMLRYFFSMFVDENTWMLDPTCGSGSSLRACESLNGKGLGLEVNPDFAEIARGALRRFRLLKSTEK